MRISGSIGFTGAARSVLLAVQDPNDESRCILAVVKSNLARFPTPQAYRIEDALAGTVFTFRVVWLGDAPEVGVRQLLSVADARPRDDAVRFLIAARVHMVARPAADLEREAKAEGLSIRTLRRARDELGIDKWQDGFHGGWWWGPRDSRDTGDTPQGPTNTFPVAPVNLPAETTPIEVTGTQGTRLGMAHVRRAVPAPRRMATTATVRAAPSTTGGWSWMPENSAGRGRRYLAEGRLLVTTVTDRVVVAKCRGDGEIYQLAGDPSGWSCNCPALTENCCHLVALRLVVLRPLGLMGRGREGIVG
jgi:hypothetical protein